MKLQVTGFATVAGSSKLAPEVKETILKTKDGKAKFVLAKLLDAEGKEVVLKGPVKLSGKGSLTARFALKVESFELVDLDDPNVEKKTPTKEEREEERVNKLAEELLG